MIGRYVVMGVAGAGKSVVGEGFARALGLPFVEGDDLHPAENVARMAAGIPLTDDDRFGWLTTIADRLRASRDAGAGLVVSCSALKRRYRDLLRAGAADTRFIFLDGPRSLIAERLSTRHDHFMPPALLDSQLEVLEPPSPDELAWVCDIRQAPEAIVAQLVARVSTAPSSDDAR